MTGAILNLLVNVVIVVLLVVTIGYCWILNRRIKVLQDSKGELAGLLKHFDESTRRASESIIALQTASKKIGENIQMRAEKANFLLDDLAFMIEKANKVANQMEASFAVNRARNRVISEEPALQPERPAMPASSGPMIERPPVNRERTAATLEAVLERVVARNKDLMPADEKEEPRQRPNKSRSKSEQELLEMIRAGFKG